MNFKKIITIVVTTLTLTSCMSKYHVVRRGDSLSKISRISGIPVKKLKEINHLTTDKIVLGQKIYFSKAHEKIIPRKYTTGKPVVGKNRLDSKGLDLIKDFEKLSLKTYKDSGGVRTIGYGHTGPDVGRWTKISKKRAEELLEQDVSATERAVGNAIKVKTTQNQFNAMVSLAFNVGSSNFRQSTLLKYHNKKSFSRAAKEFAKWSKVGGRTSKGLLIRRKREAILYKTKSSSYVN